MSRTHRAQYVGAVTKRQVRKVARDGRASYCRCPYCQGSIHHRIKRQTPDFDLT